MLEVTVDKSKALQDINEVFDKPTILRGLTRWQMDIDAATGINLGGKVLKRRTGQLARSMGWADIKTSDFDITLTLTSDAPQARLLEHGTEGLPGGVLKPVNANHLAIPLPAAMTKAGVLRKGPREWADTFVQKSKKGNLIIFTIKGKKKLVPLFLLVDEVKIEPKRWFSTSVDDALDKLKVRIIEEENRG